MSVLLDARGKLLQLVQAVEQADTAYNHARGLYEALEAGTPVDMNGLGMNLVFDGGATIPVPLPDDRDQLLAHCERAVNFLGSEVIRIWNEIYAVATEAKQYCDAAAAQADPAVATQPAAPAQQVAPQQPPAQQPAQPVQPLQTTPVGS